MVTAAQIEERIKKHIPQAKVKANDMTGGGDHWQVNIEASEFAGLSLVEQHQMVYKALGEWLKSDIHALSMNTSAPKE
jgi:stress-induced morphogen